MTQHRFVVIGGGSIGLRHTRNLLALGQRDVIAYEPDAGRRAQLEAELGIETVPSLDAAWGRERDVAMITAPTSMHVPLALEAVRNGCAYFVEKPLSHELAGVAELVTATEEARLVSLVGCNMRFHPGMRALKEIVERETLGPILSARFEFGQYLPDFRPASDYRVSYSARRDLGGGSILDSIHELDYATWLLGPVRDVASFADHLSTLEINTEDVAAIVLRFASGAIGEVHLDYIQRAYSRTCKLIGELGTAVWDYNRADLDLFLAADGEWSAARLFDEWDANSMYLDELRHFLRCLDGAEEPIADVRAGLRSLSIALASKASASERRVVSPESLLDGIA